MAGDLHGNHNNHNAHRAGGAAPAGAVAPLGASASSSSSSAAAAVSPHHHQQQQQSSSSSSSFGSHYQHYYSSFRRKHQQPNGVSSFSLTSFLPRRSGNHHNGGTPRAVRGFATLSSSNRPHSKAYFSNHRRSSTAATFWIGMMMFVLAVVYVLVVVVVAKFHLVHLQPTMPSTPLKTSPVDAMHHENNIRNQHPKKKKEERVVDSSSRQDSGQRNDNKDGADAAPPPPPGSFVLTAFVEPLNLDEWDTKPLPRRSQAQQSLLHPVAYPQLTQCSKLPEQWPVDDSTKQTDGSVSSGNPVDRDPFLPWIHDVFPTEDGKYVQFVAQNKRRCRTGVRERHIMDHMQPQVALFQHVSVQRVLSNATTDGKHDSKDTRYKLVPYEQADPDGITTRFICRFKQSSHGTLATPKQLETLAIHNFDYDWTGFRKRYKAAFLKDDGGIKSIHTTQLLFRCPIPREWQPAVRNGSTVVNDYATLFVDVVPIRTPPRYGVTNRYLAPWFAEFNSQSEPDKFDPIAEYGHDHILPLIEDSGRWENVPICLPSLMTYENQKASDLPLLPTDPSSPYDSVRDSTAMASIPMSSPVKKHRLVSCIWASAGYATRGERFSINDGQRRLMEWLHHNINIGFDHFYLYDNSAAFDPTNNLKGIADLFPDHVTYINWPSKVCNNRPNNVDSPGERSSQYAAESSCRLRFGPHVEWIGQFDIDEYLIPMGEHKSALSLLDKLDKEDTRIVSFGSWRAWPRFALIEEPVPITSQKECWHTEPCFDLRIPLSTTMLQAYNCDRQPPGQKKVQMPAEKQLYRAAYVTQHFVHYSASTILSALNRTAFSKAGFDWWRRPFPDPRQRFANEIDEGLMIHSKAVAHQDTAGWKTFCSVDSLNLEPKDRGMCRLGVPFPTSPTENNYTDDGWMYNCYVNPKVEELYVPMLEKALKPHLSYFGARGDVAPKP